MNRFFYILLLCLVGGLSHAQIVTQTVNDAYFGWHGGTNRLETAGFPQYWTDTFAWHADNTATKTPRVYNTSDDVLQAQFTVGADGDESCHIARAWSIQSHASNIVVAIIDKSFDLSHPELIGRWWINPATGVPGIAVDNAGTMTTNVNINPAERHGTMTAGIIGARGDNTNGVAGVCKDGIILMPIATSGTYASRGFCLEFAATNGADIIVWATGSSSQRTTWTNGFTLAQQNGCLVMCAAFESSSVIHHDIGGEYATFPVRDYPTQWGRNLSTNIIPWLSNMVVVGASIPDGTRYSISGWSTNFVDLMYPGLRIPSCMPPSSYASYNGTSPAVAIAAGDAALLMERYSCEDFMQIKERMMSNVTVRASYATNCFTGGHGNSYQSLSWERPAPPKSFRLRLN